MSPSPSSIADCGSEESFMDMLSQNFPKTKHSYDTITMALILAPSFAAVVCNDKVHLPTLMSDLITLALVAWVVRFLSNWPAKWVKHLKQVRASMLNFVNSVKIEIGQAFFLPEMALNRRVFVSNLVVARRLVRLEQLAWVGGIFGVLVGAGLMVTTRCYLIDSTEYRNEVFSNSTIALYVVWNLFKLASQYLDSVKSSISFSKTTNVENSVNDNNLQYYIDMFCSDVPLPTMSPKKPKEAIVEPVVEEPLDLNEGQPKRNSRGISHSKNSSKKPNKSGGPKRPPKLEFKTKPHRTEPKNSSILTKKPEVKDFRESSIFLTPFPLKGSNVTFKKKEITIRPPPDSHLQTLSPIQEDSEVMSGIIEQLLDEPKQIQEMSTEEEQDTQAESKPGAKETNPSRVSVTGIAIPEASDPSITRSQFREWHIKDIEADSPSSSPLEPRSPLKFQRTGENEVVGRMKQLTEFHGKKVQKDWDEVRSKLSSLKETCYESAWQYAEEMGKADWSEVLTLWFLATIFIISPMKMAAKLAFFFVRLPFMATRLYISLSLYIPLLIFKLAVMAPARLLLGLVTDSASGEIALKEYRVAQSLPMLKEQSTMKLIKSFSKLIHGDSDEPRVAVGQAENL